MIGKVTRGQRVVGLLHYLYGPGRANEHTNPHLAAAWDAPAHLEPGLRPDGRHDLKRLGDLLQQPLHISPTTPDKPVWHCALRTAPEDPALSDAEWDRVAREVLHRTGLAPRGDAGACRWVAVRHADDHVHLVVTLARQDGARVTVFRDYFQVGAACRAEEERLGLRRAAVPDRTAAVRPTRAETERVLREGRRQAPRVVLRRDVQLAAARADSPEAFLAELRGAGVLVRERRSEHDPEQITGYAVALPGNNAADGSPIWFGGSKLAPELSWGRLQHRWDLHIVQHLAPTSGLADTQGREREAGADSAWTSARGTLEEAATEVATATARLATGSSSPDPHSPSGLLVSGIALASCDVITVSARLIDGRTDGHLTEACDMAWRAARVPHGRTSLPSPLSLALRHSARTLARMPRPAGADAEAWRTVHDLLRATVRLAEAIADLRDTQQLIAQAKAARRSSAAIQAALSERNGGRQVGAGTRRRVPLPSSALDVTRLPLLPVCTPARRR